MELKRQKTKSCAGYSWTDYISLPFTQNVRSIGIIKETKKLTVYS